MYRNVNVWVVFEIKNPFNVMVYYSKDRIPDEIWNDHAGIRIPKGQERKYHIREFSMKDSLEFYKEITNEVLDGISSVNISYDVEGGKIVGQNIEVS